MAPWAAPWTAPWPHAALTRAPCTVLLAAMHATAAAWRHRDARYAFACTMHRTEAKKKVL